MVILAQPTDPKSVMPKPAARKDTPDPTEFGAMLQETEPTVDATEEAPAEPQESSEVADEEPTTPVALPTPVPPQISAQAATFIAPSAVTNPVVQAVIAVESPAATTVAAIEAVSSVASQAEPAPLKLPKAPDDIRLDVAVVEVPPVEEPGVAAVEVPEEPFTDEEPFLDDLPEEPPAKPEESSDQAPAPANVADPRPIRAGTHVHTAEGPQIRLDTHNMVRELADRLQLMAAARQKEGVVVQLEPPNLGQITLLVKPEGSGVSAEITATHDQVRQALVDSQPQLQRRLELRGVVVADVSVSAETSNHNPQKRSGTSQPDRPISPVSFASEGSKGISAASVPVVKRMRRASGLDLWI